LYKYLNTLSISRDISIYCDTSRYISALQLSRTWKLSACLGTVCVCYCFEFIHACSSTPFLLFVSLIQKLFFLCVWISTLRLNNYFWRNMGWNKNRLPDRYLNISVVNKIVRLLLLFVTRCLDYPMIVRQYPGIPQYIASFLWTR
jgi:hypothetical protein